MSEVRPGQIWKDNDKRVGQDRQLEILRVVPPFAYCRSVADRGNSAREVRIQLTRFRPTSTGYVLLSDVSPAGMETEPLYYIQNVGYQGNCMKFWRPDGKGYTVDLNDAWKVTKAEADEICRSRPKEDIPHLASTIDAIAQRHASIEVLRSATREAAK